MASVGTIFQKHVSKVIIKGAETAAVAHQRYPSKKFPERGETQGHRNRWEKNCQQDNRKQHKWHQEQRRPSASVWRRPVAQKCKALTRKIREEGDCLSPEFSFQWTLRTSVIMNNQDCSQQCKLLSLWYHTLTVNLWLAGTKTFLYVVAVFNMVQEIPICPVLLISKFSRKFHFRVKLVWFPGLPNRAIHVLSSLEDTMKDIFSYKGRTHTSCSCILCQLICKYNFIPTLRTAV